MNILLNYSFLITFGILSILSVNLVHCIINLIALFLSTSIFMIIFNLIFLGLIFLAVYLGAIAILFLFIIMMIDVKVYNHAHLYMRNWKFFDFFFIFLLTSLFILNNNFVDYLFELKNFISILLINDIKLTSLNMVDKFNFYLLVDDSNFLYEFSYFLFTNYLIAFLECGFILFIGMVGAIVLTVEPIINKFLFQQDPGYQSNYKRKIVYI